MISFTQVSKKFPEAFEAERGNGRAYIVNCWKYHKHGGIGEMEIKPESGIFHCHNCGHSGTLYEEFPDHFDDLAEYFSWVGVKTEGAISSAPRVVTRVNKSGIMWSPTVSAPGETIPFSDLSGDHPAVEYLRGRDFDIEELRGFSKNLDIRALYYCTRGQHSVAEGKGTLSGRIIFPIYGEDLIAPPGGGTPVLTPVLKGWQARQVEKVEDSDDGEIKKVWHGFSWKTFKKKSDGEWEDKFVPKYCTMFGMKKSKILGGMLHAKGYPDVAVVEGPLDYYKTGRHCVYTLGKSLSKDQIRLLQANWRRVFLIRDPEINPDDPKFRSMIQDLHPLVVHHLVLSGMRDPGACPRVETWKQIADHVGDPKLKQYASA